MRYNEKSGKIEIGVYELVATARRGISPLCPKDIDEPESGHENPPSSLSLQLEFKSGNTDFLIKTSLPAESEQYKITHKIERISQRRLPTREEKSQARGEGYILSHLLYKSEKLQDSSREIMLDIIYENRGTGEAVCESETVSPARAEAFFDKCTSTLAKRGEAEIERVRERLPSMRGLKFPFSEMRPGQSEFIKSVYRTIARGETLFSAAPTGTGKTVSALFPAIRALGDGRVDKAFYLTPKSTTADAARDLLCLMSEGGLNVRAVILLAKERLCSRGMLCQRSSHSCDSMAKNKLRDAAHALFDKHLTVVTPNDLKSTARDFDTCPYELSLEYSELCDIIICDFNYLFDPDVYIRRFFTRGGEYAFLIDEAHNLVERAREMYSAELSRSDFLSLRDSGLFGDFANLPIGASVSQEKLYRAVYPYIRDEIRTDKTGKKSAFYHTRNIPRELFDIIGDALDFAEEELLSARNARDSESDERRRLIQSYTMKLRRFMRTLSVFGDGYELFIFLDGEDFRIKLFAIDPAEPIRERLALGRSAVFFSGTLSPIDYYKTVLGGDRASRTLTLPSPFSEEQLTVAVMDKISTRTSERDKTIMAVLRVIVATISAKRGNYIVFSPSFAYSEALYNLFKTRYPKMRTLLQKSQMSIKEKEEFIGAFKEDSESYLVGFAVMGGIYSEGIDLVGDSLIGTVIVGIGMPALSVEREAIAAYYEERLDEGKQYAYIYPGMNRVLQAGGRVIRSEKDKGVIVLIDDRFDDPIYKKTAPELWRGMKFFSDAKELKSELDKFWQEN